MLSPDSSFVIGNLLLLLHCQVNFRMLCCYFTHEDNILNLGRLSVTEAHTRVQIGIVKNGELRDGGLLA